MNDFLKKLIERKKNEIENLKKRSEESQDLAEVRAIGVQLEALKKEVEEAEAQLKEVERSTVPANAELRNAVVVSSNGNGGNVDMNEKEMQYRQAFMEYILRGTVIPAELRGDENTTTSEVGSVIPTVLVNRIIDRMEKTGEILKLITRTSIAAGVEVPTLTLKPTATWVNEGASSDRQKVTTDKVSFTYHKLRCEVSISMEVSTMAISAFEDKFVELIANAMIYEIEEAIINGTGSGQPKGILAETPVSGQAIASAALSFPKICEIEAALPEKYEGNAKWCMNKTTFLKVAALVDDNGQPIGKVNYGIGGVPERYILGREVFVCSHVEANQMFIFDFADYILNTVYNMGIQRKQDWDTEDMLTKAVMSVDGKVIDKGSLVTFEIATAV